MIAFVEEHVLVEPHGENFLITFISGGEKLELMLTAKAFFMHKCGCMEAYAKRQVMELEAREKVIAFPKPKRQRPRA